ncbi:DUF2203 domain-containing protein [Candidatus Woesearchaeota archaeon]|nr:DUF2203 domain-containing protein [Candidatus Woesearchaeota archaeon]
MKKILRKYFSLKQAEKLIPKLEKRISKLMEINRIITLLNTVNVAYDDEFEGLSDEIQRHKETHQASFEFYKEIEALLEIGVIVKDLEQGLVDFHSIYYGREIFLCWKLGERKIEFWHEVEDGYLGRQHISLLESNYQK